jgi:hypothetical protein
MNFRKMIFLFTGVLFFFAFYLMLPFTASSQTITLKYANFPPAPTFP